MHLYIIYKFTMFYVIFYQQKKNAFKSILYINIIHMYSYMNVLFSIYLFALSITNRERVLYFTDFRSSFSVYYLYLKFVLV